MMNRLFLILLAYGFAMRPTYGEDRQWDFESKTSDAFVVRGSIVSTNGVTGKGIALDGQSFIELRQSESLSQSDPGFTFTIWVNPYALRHQQQMIAAKNRYGLNERQWGVMIDKDDRFRLYLWQGAWKTIEAKSPPKVGHWHQVGVIVRPGQAELWINDEQAGEIKLKKPMPKTKAPLTFGGVNDNGRMRQHFFGSLDEGRLYDKPFSADEMKAGYKPVTVQHKVPSPTAGLVADSTSFLLWDPLVKLPRTEDIPVLDRVEFRVIKKWEPKVDGYKWLHGVGLVWHKGKLYASFGHNKGRENTLTEEGRYCVSEDEGKTWSKVRTIDVGTGAEDLAVSHGVFLSHANTLWAFLGAFHGTRQRVHTRAYTLNEKNGEWEPQGVVVENGFWPMTEPVKMEDGHWIMSGFQVGKGNPAAVAISQGDDLKAWRAVTIPPLKGQRMWGESSVIVDGPNVLNIARFGHRAFALAAVSQDFGKTWTASQKSNLPMATSKPYSGILSSGERYLICTTTADSGSRRAPLTIALSRPGEKLFSKVFVIRHRALPDGVDDGREPGFLSYPYAVEHAGKLYVGYSNNGGRGGNHNAAELAIIPVEQLF